MRLAILVEGFPKLSETFVVSEAVALRELGHDVRIEARSRPPGPGPQAAADGGLPVAYAFQATRRARLLALARLGARHPLRCLRDLLGRGRWRAQEEVLPLRVLAPTALRLRAAEIEHLHVHFATGPALDALRLSRLLGLPWSVIAHGMDVFQQPRNLEAKLSEATLALAPCAYTARALEAAAPGVGVEVVVMGVDVRRFARTEAHPGGRTVAAVGRLVEKKGFVHLVDALAHVDVDRAWIVGDGPLRGALEARAAALGLADRVTFTGALRADEVRGVLEHAAVLAMPCVVAADGDRDAMPVVVKEALAMEVPVVASDAVGLPEVVQDRWGRLVAPGDPRALAHALDDVLSLAPERRAAMGAAGRAHVERHCDVRAEAARLAMLLEAAR